MLKTATTRRQPVSEWRLNAILQMLDEAEVRRTAVSMYKQNALQLAIPEYGRRSHPATWEQAQKTIDLPTLALFGEDDDCITGTTFRIATRAEDFPRGVTLEMMAGVGHFMHWHDGPGFNARILAFIHDHGHGSNGSNGSGEGGKKKPAEEAGAPPVSFRNEL